MAEPQGWKQQAASQASAQPGQRGWQQQAGQPATAAPRRWSRRSKLFLATSLLSLLVGMVVIVILWLRPAKPACLILIGSSYDEYLPIPHNAYGWKGLLDLAEAAEKSSTLISWGSADNLRVQFGPKEVAHSNPWTKVWGEVPKKVSEKTVILFLALHGGGDRNGPYFLVADAKGPQRLPFEQVLTDIGSEFKDKNVVLIVDASQIRADWPLGILHNDFAGRLKALDKKIEGIPNLIVMASADVDQISWPSEEWRQTIFAHYIVEGLKGAADKNGNLRITGQELFQYVGDKVKTWVQANRDAVQTPLLLGGEERARSFELVQIPSAYAEADPATAPGKLFTPPKELEAAWEEHAELLKGAPPPYVYAPQLWRQYEEALLRYEQLLRAGDPTSKVSELKSTLSRLKEGIAAAQALEPAFPAQGNAFPLPLALGLTAPWNADEIRSKFQSLWTAANDQQRRESMDKIVAWADGNSGTRDKNAIRQLLQSHLSRALIDTLLSGVGLTASDLAPDSPGKECKARIVLRLIENSLGQARAAETHLLLMLLMHGDAKLSAADMQKALRCRLLAEQAALGFPHEAVTPYSEALAPWLLAKVVAADKVRRPGEDWLFGSTPKAWAKAGSLLDEAHKKYQDLTDGADVLRRAMAMRDRAAADLPHYAQWLSRLRLPANEQDRQKLQALMQQVEHLARNLEALSLRLDPPDPKAKDLSYIPEDENNPRRLTLKDLLKELSAKLAKDLSDPKEGLQQGFAASCDSLKDVHLQSRWHDIEAALAVPLIDSYSVRQALLRNSREISSKLNAGEAKFEGVAVSEDMQENAARQQKLALALLDRRGLPGPLPTTGGEGTWRSNLVALEEYLASYYKNLPTQISQTLASSLGQADLKKAAADLVDSAGLCRSVPAGWLTDAAQKPFAPPLGLRRLRAHDLLVWQAQRTVDDHWFSEFAEKTYYQPTASAYLQGALRLAEGKVEEEELTRKRQDDARTMQASLKQAGLVAENLANSHWTTEVRFPLAWSLKPQGPDVPAGIPMVWLALDGQTATPPDPALAERKPAEPWPPGKIPFQLSRSLWTKDEEGQKLKATLRGVYRGQTIAAANQIFFYPKPDLLVSHFEPPNSAGLAIRMDKDFTYGALSVMLDYSGSMAFGYPNKDQSKKRRIDFALDALRTVLKTVPDGTYLSVLIFRQEKNTDQTSTIRLVREPQMWKGSQIETLIGKLEALALEPKGGSPIARAIIQAGDEGFPPPSKYQGPKVVLALTDGDDNESFANNNILHQRLSAAFDTAGIEVNVVCFNDPNDKEGINARDQFKVVEKFDPAGRFIVQPDGFLLARTLEETIRPRLFLYQDNVLATGFPRQGALISPPTGELQWFSVPPKLFTAKVQQRITQDIKLNGGDNVLITLKRVDNQVVFERAIFSDEPINANKPAGATVNRWKVGLLEHRLKGQSTLHEVITVEDSLGKAALLGQKHPGLLWLDIKPPADKKPRNLHWFNDGSYPAPAFRVEAHSWPLRDDGGPETPEVRLWWSGEPVPRDPAFTKFLEQPSAWNDREVAIGGSKLRIDSITVEEHEMSLGPDGPVSPKSCLVVRITHDAGKPVFVQVVGPPRRPGEAHHYFPWANKYTAFFYNLSDPMSVSLNIVSLESFKADPGTATVVLRPVRTAPGPDRILLKNAE